MHTGKKGFSCYPPPLCSQGCQGYHKKVNPKGEGKKGRWKNKMHTQPPLHIPHSYMHTWKTSQKCVLADKHEEKLYRFIPLHRRQELHWLTYFYFNFGFAFSCCLATRTGRQSISLLFWFKQAAQSIMSKHAHWQRERVCVMYYTRMDKKLDCIGASWRKHWQARPRFGRGPPMCVCSPSILG
jgi:hypothetical protein